MKIPASASVDVQQAFREVYAALDPLTGGRNIDLNGRRIINAGAPVDDGDYVTRGDLQTQVSGPLAAIASATSDAGKLRGNTLAANVIYSSLQTFGILTADLLFVDAAYDIGKAGATRPRNVYVSDAVFTPILKSTVAGGLAVMATHAAGVVDIYAGGSTAWVEVGITGNVGMAATKKLFFDGITGSGDTYIRETSANLLEAFAGGTLTWSATLGCLGVGRAAAAGFAIRVKSAGSGAGNFVASFVDSADTVMLNVRDDGVIYTGQGANSLYNLTSASAANVVVDSAGILYRSTSARKYKRDIVPLTAGLDALCALQPVEFSEAPLPEGRMPTFGIGPRPLDTRRFIGVIADDSVKPTPLLVTYGPNGEIEGYQYDRLGVYAINAFKELRDRVSALEAKAA